VWKRNTAMEEKYCQVFAVHTSFSCAIPLQRPSPHIFLDKLKWVEKNEKINWYRYTTWYRYLVTRKRNFDFPLPGILNNQPKNLQKRINKIIEQGKKR
jgi:hypothetical protein